MAIADARALRRIAAQIREKSRHMAHPRSREINEKIAREFERKAEELERSGKITEDDA